MAETLQPLNLGMRGIRKSYAGVEVLHGVDFEVRAGEVHALVGENGAGKSTLMKILAGDVHQDSGTIDINGSDVAFRSPQESQAAGIAMIHQELSYVGALTVAENLLLGRLPTRNGVVSRGRLLARAREIITKTGVPIDPGARMDAISVSQRQIVEILRAVDRNARLIVMDEPTSSLTGREVQLLFSIIGTVRAAGVSVVYISHHLDEIFTVADRVTVLRDGMAVSVRDVPASNQDTLIREMVGGSIGEGRIRAHKPRTQVLLDVRELSIDEDVKSVNFQVAAGEVFAMYGLLGAGQERIARVFYGLEPRHTGIIRLGGERLRPRTPRAAIASGVGFVPSDRKIEGIVPKRGVRENVTYPSLRDISRLGVLRLRSERELVRSVSGKLRIKAQPGQLVGSLSGGNQQKVVVSRWFARPVRLLVLTDPTRGVDVRVKAEIHALIDELASTGVGVLVISGDLPEVVELADRIAVIRRGEVVAELDGNATSVEEVLRFAAGGNAA